MSENIKHALLDNAEMGRANAKIEFEDFHGVTVPKRYGSEACIGLHAPTEFITPDGTYWQEGSEWTLQLYQFDEDTNTVSAVLISLDAMYALHQRREAFFEAARVDGVGLASATIREGYKETYRLIREKGVKVIFHAQEESGACHVDWSAAYYW